MQRGEKEFYNAYWKQRKGSAGDRCGYARNLRRWMARELTGLSSSESILEIGCGDCQFTLDLAKFSSDVHAIDISEWQIALNRQRHPSIKFTTHDLRERMPFPDNSFSIIWCSELLEHLSQPRFALEEFHRVLRVGARLLLTVPYHGMFKNLLIALFKWDRHFDPEYPHLQYFTTTTLRRLVEKVGFSNVRTQTCGINSPLRDILIPTNILLRAIKSLPQ